MKNDKAIRLFELALKYVQKNIPSELSWARNISAQTFEDLTQQHFLIEYCWVIYVSGFRVSIIEDKFRRLSQAFQEFDIDKVNKMKSIEPVLSIINNRGKAQGFLKGSRKINKEGFSNFKMRVKQKGMEVLQELPFIGPITQKHLAKNIGLHDISKDDRWLVLIANKLNATNVEELIIFLAHNFGESQHVVDLVLWNFCANSGWKYYSCDVLDNFLSQKC